MEDEVARAGGLAAAHRRQEQLGGAAHDRDLDGAELGDGATHLAEAAEETALGDHHAALVTGEEARRDVGEAADAIALVAARDEAFGFEEVARLREATLPEGGLSVAQKVRAAPD
jgi:hypothetical protein